MVEAPIFVSPIHIGKNIECRPFHRPLRTVRTDRTDRGLPIVPPFLQCFSRDPQTKADEFQRENPLARCLVTKRAREATLEEAGQLRREISYEITGPPIRSLLDTSALSHTRLAVVTLATPRDASPHGVDH